MLILLKFFPLFLQTFIWSQVVSCNAALSVHALEGKVFRHSLWLMGSQSSNSLQLFLNCVALTPGFVTQIYPAGVFFRAFSCGKSTLKQDKMRNLLPLCTAGCKACGQCSETRAAMKLFRSMQKDRFWKQESWVGKDSIWVARTAKNDAIYAICKRMSFVQASLQTVRQEQFHPNQAAATKVTRSILKSCKLQLHFSGSWIMSIYGL